MPRRPRPAHRPPPHTQDNVRAARITYPSNTTNVKALITPGPSKPATEEAHSEAQLSEVEGEFPDAEDDIEGEDSQREEEEGEDDLPDAPRVAQWADDDDLEQPGPSTLKTLQRDLSTLPLGALRKARLALPEAVADSSGGSDLELQSENEDDEPSEEEVENSKQGDEKPRKVIAKRAHKHAPIEITSRKPVTRRMQVVEVKKQEARDPRFLPLAGDFSAQKFRQSYGFLADSHKKELATLKDSLKRARKLLANSPRHLYEEREEEVKRLELAVKRAESQVDRDRKEKVEQDALSKMAKEEREKRKEGKGEWYMKKSNQREVLARARYDALAAEGGNRAVKKAIDKKQKKIGQKEKKSRPFSMKRRPETGSMPSGRDSKRRKVG